MRRRWIIYYTLSLLAFAGVNGFFYYVLDPFEGYGMMAFYFLQGIACIIIGILQILAIILLLATKALTPRIIIAFTAVYSLFLTSMYGWAAHKLYSTVYFIEGFAEDTGEYQQRPSELNPWLGMHTWFLLPLVFQVIMYFLLYRRSKIIERENYLSVN